MRYHVFESGSKGNATLITSSHGNLIIDNGLSKKTFLNKLASVSVGLEQINAVLVTHGHDDHIKGMKVFTHDLIYSSSETFSSIKKVIGLDDSFKMMPSHILKPYQKLKISGFDIEVIPTSHDAQGSFGFIIRDDNEKLVYITDTGFIYEKCLPKLQDADYYIFESNHDVRMLLNTNRPQSLKDRILGDRGHLSNADSALYLSEIIGPNTKEIIFAHISQEANTEEKVIETFLKIMEKRGIVLENITYRCSSQIDTVSGGIIYKELLNA